MMTSSPSFTRDIPIVPSIEMNTISIKQLYHEPVMAFVGGRRWEWPKMDAVWENALYFLKSWYLIAPLANKNAVCNMNSAPLFLQLLTKLKKNK